MWRKCYSFFSTNLLFLCFANNYISVFGQAEKFCRGLWKEQGEEGRRRDGKITSRNGQEWSWEIAWGQRKTEGWIGIVATSSVVPRRPSRLWDWYEMSTFFQYRYWVSCMMSLICKDRLDLSNTINAKTTPFKVFIISLVNFIVNTCTLNLWLSKFWLQQPQTLAAMYMWSRLLMFRQV